MITPYEQMLEQAGFPVAAGPLKEWFAREQIDNPQLQLELAFSVLQRTLQALELLARARTVH